MNEQAGSKHAHTQPRAEGIEATDLAFAYDGTPIFADVNFRIPAGQVWALIGRSGIGKSTLLNVILGLFRPSRGHVSIRDGTVVSPGQIRGAVFQEESLLWWHTVLENVVRFHRRRQAEDTLPKARDLLEAAGLVNLEQRHPKQLSMGMRKRVELVRALLIDDEFFVADEPFTALDVQTRTELYGVWEKLRAENPRTGIICTHDPIEAVTLCDAVVVLQHKMMQPATALVVNIPDGIKADKDATKSIAFNDFIAGLVGLMK